MVLDRLQRGLEAMYRIDTRVEVGDYMIDATARQCVGVARRPREQLLLVESDGVLEIGLFVDPASLDNLARHDPTSGLDERNLGDFLLAVEGVSHFVYTVWRARAGHSVSALELELQAEIDKYITCLLVGDVEEGTSDRLRRRLFDEVLFDDDLDDGERARYVTANENARQYSASLERRYVRRRRIADMLAELRHFYRMSLSTKLAFIVSAM